MILLLGNGNQNARRPKPAEVSSRTLVVQRYPVVVRSGAQVYVRRNNDLRLSLFTGTVQPR
jgi:hypothetical protein